MAHFKIVGGQKLSGKVRPAGNKNEALPALMACLLTDQAVTLRRVPRIADVLTVCEILEGLGVSVKWTDTETVILHAKEVKSFKPVPHLCAKVRASILLLGPMLARTGHLELPLPGGDVIGARRIDSHFEGIESLGAKVSFGATIAATLKKGHGTDIFMDEPSVTATENLVMLATMCPGVTILHNAACEPHVIGLCDMLMAMGAKIEGIGSNRLTIRGVEALHGCTHTIGPDFMEVGSFLCLGAIGGGRVEIEDVNMNDLRFVLKILGKLGISPQISGHNLIIEGTERLHVKREISGRIATIYSQPWPAFPTDLMSVAIVAATQAQGTLIFFEKMYEARMFFTDKLMQMGANIVLCDPHRVVVTGPSRLFAARMSSPDVRAGMSLLMAALIAEGESTIDNIYQIERGYMDIEKKVKALGGEIERIE